MWLTVTALVAIAGLIYYFFFSSKKSYWKKYGVREIDTSGVVSQLDIFLSRQSLISVDDFLYKELGDDKFCGYEESGKPQILVKDLELLKKVLIKDFDHFMDRRTFFTENDGIPRKMLAALSGDEWKGVRASMSPTFTTGKIRRMMEYFNSVGQEWVDDLTAKAKESGAESVTIDVLKSVNTFTVDVIGSAVFGMNTGTIKNPNSTFATMVTRIADMNTKMLIKFAMIFMMPKVFKLLRLKLFDEEATLFFQRILEQGIQARMKGEVKRVDFLHVMVEAKKGELKADGNDELSTFEKDAQVVGGTAKKQYLTEEIIIAQSIGFFFAGFSTIGNFLTFTMYILAAHQNIQEKLRKEMGKIVKEDGSLDYDEVGQHVYLDMVVCEVLRQFPGLKRIERLCVKDYKDPDSGLFVPKGTLVVIPVNSFHHDQRYYENPDKFDPEHFTPEKKAERSPYVYMPFGSGPRNCIGMRFALIESKTAIAKLVHNFLIEPTAKTPLPVKGRYVGFSDAPPKNLELKLTPIRREK